MKKSALVVVLALLLTACGGSQTVKPTVPAPTPKETAPATKPAPGKKGGYYLDDGPGDNPPVDIDSIPDAVPRAEVPLSRANRPYSALGSRYTPMTEYTPYKQTGVASWYGKRYHGQKTSSGEIYDMYGMTGAHTILPLPSYARVTNPANGRSVIVRINDRGPFHSERIIDLSYAAAYKLRLHEKGRGVVEVEAIDTRVSNMVKLPAVPAAPAEPPVASPAPVVVAEKPAVAEKPVAPPAVIDPPLTPATTIASPAATSSDMASGDYVQVAAFKGKTNAENLVQKIQQQGLNGSTSAFSWYNADVYKVRIGPFATRAEAEAASKKIGPALNVKPVIVHIP